VLLGLAEGLGMDDDLMLTVNGGHAVVTLDYPVRGLHLGGVVVCDVALPGLAGLTGLVVVMGQPLPDLLGALAQCGHILLFPGRTILVGLLPVMFAVGSDDMRDGCLKLDRLLLEIGPGAAPLLASVAGYLAAVDGEHLLADQPQVIANQEHVTEQMDDLLVHGGDEIGDGSEMGPGVGGQGHEDDVLPAGLLDLPAGDDASRIGIEDDLQEDPRIRGS